MYTAGFINTFQIRQMNLHLGLDPGSDDVKPVIFDAVSLAHRQPHDHTQILLDAAQLAQEQEAREAMASSSHHELLDHKQHLQQTMTPSTALEAAASPANNDPTSQDVVKVFKQVHTKVVPGECYLFWEIDSV